MTKIAPAWKLAKEALAIIFRMSPAPTLPQTLRTMIKFLVWLTRWWLFANATEARDSPSFAKNRFVNALCIRLQHGVGCGAAHASGATKKMPSSLIDGIFHLNSMVFGCLGKGEESKRCCPGGQHTCEECIRRRRWRPHPASECRVLLCKYPYKHYMFHRVCVYCGDIGCRRRCRQTK